MYSINTVQFACVCAYICVCVCSLQLGPWTLTGLSLLRVCEHCWHTHFFPQKVTLSPIGNGLLRTHTDNFSKAMQIWHCGNSTFCNVYLKSQFIQITKKHVFHLLPPHGTVSICEYSSRSICRSFGKCNWYFYNNIMDVSGMAFVVLTALKSNIWQINSNAFTLGLFHNKDWKTDCEVWRVFM